MRRKVFRLTLAHCSKGITPAHAGKRGSLSQCACISRDHPRTCGEKVDEIVDTNEQVGSPPHMRGKEVQADGAPGDAGITPAHAGKSLFVSALQTSVSDHPRTCGEKPHSRRLSPGNMGSPPHMRGKAHPPCWEWKSPRITPAHAGKRAAPDRPVRRGRDHPRTCGEKCR